MSIGLDFAAVSKFEEKQEEGHTFEVKGPDGKVLEWEGKPVTITVCGTYSRTYQELEEEFHRTWLADQVANVPAEQREEALREAWSRRDRELDQRVRSRCIKDWYGVVEDGKPLEVNHKNAERLMQVPWLRSQVRMAQVQHEGFFVSASDG